MVLTFTGSLSAASSGHNEVRTMLIGALGCNLAWGIIDAIFYLMNTLGARGHGVVALRRLRRGASPEEARALIAEALPPALASVLRSEDFDLLRQRLETLPEPPARAPLHRDDLRGALGVFLLVFLSTFPVAIPFLVMQNAMLALRVSNGIAIVLLFVGRLQAGEVHRLPSLADRPWNGRHRRRPRRPHDRARRMKVRSGLALAALFALCAMPAAAQEAAAAATGPEEEKSWEFNASVYGYFPPEDHHYAQPTVLANHGALHLEGRYNYEGPKAGSAWVGWNVGAGEKLRLDATLMAGGVFGDTTRRRAGIRAHPFLRPLRALQRGRVRRSTPTTPATTSSTTGRSSAIRRSIGFRSASLRSGPGCTRRASTCSGASSSASSTRA